MDIRVILTEFLVGVTAVILLIQFLISESTFDYIWKGALFFLFLFFGYLLIRNVLQEIKRRAELQKLYEQVEKLSKSKSEFISIASHQLRTPLSVTKGYISLILEGTYDKISSKLKKPLQNIYSSNERLIKLINDLLDVSRIESGKIEMDFEQVSLKEFSELVSSVVEEFKLPAKKQKLSLTWFKPARKMPQKLVNVDRNKIRQVIANFIDNAIKYTKQGGITVRMKILPSAIRIEIEDTGAGMKKGEIESLFKSFARGSVGVRVATEGLGLGLYVARMFAEMHNGRVWAESEGKDKGSSFYLELPFI